MTRPGIGVRWWLALAFGIVAGATAATVVSIFSSRSQQAFRSRAEELAAGEAFVAAQRLAGELGSGVRPATALRRVVGPGGVSAFLYRDSGKLLSAAGPAAHEPGAAAVRSVRAGHRFVASSDSGRHVVVAVPLAAPGIAGLVILSSRRELPAELRVVRSAAFGAGLLAGLLGAAVGLLLAQLIALRLRRLARAAEAIRRGDFETSLADRFPDEFGTAAQALERMRLELRRSFGRLESERDRLRLLLGRLREGVVSVDRGLVVQLANAEAARILGPALREGEPLPEGGELRLRRRLARLFAGDEQPQARVALPDGRTVAVEAVPGEDGGGAAALLVLADLSEDERRELSEREFVANAAHELRTPLTTIVGAVEVLQAGAKEDPEERDRFLAHIEREAGRLARLARVLLVLARAQTRAELPPLEPVELRPLLEEVAALLVPPPGVAVQVECPAGLAVTADPELLEQALRNLGENAAKHTARGRIALRAAAHRDGVLLEVEDTGAGIGPEAQRHVFDRFYRGRDRDADGFGLGLAIVRQSVLALGGRIELHSAPGAGTRVSIRLAAAHEEAAA